MARPLRIDEPGLTYHITARGNERKKIFLDEVDRHMFLDLLADIAEWRRLLCCGYCLMENHYHAIVRTQDANLSRAIRDLNGRYAQWWNHRHGLVGHMFQGRFGSQVIQDEDYFVVACRYVVRNPVRAGLVAAPQDWPWSSYAATAGITPAPSFLCRELVLRQFDARVDRAVIRYRQYVESADDLNDRPLSADPIVGEATFVARFKAWREGAGTEVPRLVRSELPPSLAALLQGAVSRGARSAAILLAYRHGYTLGSIAGYLGVHYTTVSKIIRAGKMGSGHEETDEERPDPGGRRVGRGWRWQQTRLPPA